MKRQDALLTAILTVCTGLLVLAIIWLFYVILPSKTANNYQVIIDDVRDESSVDQQEETRTEEQSDSETPSEAVEGEDDGGEVETIEEPPDTTATTINWVSADGFVGFSTPVGNEAFATGRKIGIRELGTTNSSAVINYDTLLGVDEFTTYEEAYEQQKNTFLADSSISSYETCRRQVIGGVVAECFLVETTIGQITVYTLPVSRYFVRVYFYAGAVLTTDTLNIAWLPGQDYTSSARTIQ